MEAGAASFAVSYSCNRVIGVEALERNNGLDGFLAEVERRALRIAEIAVRDRDEALDIVQDAMIKLARKYASRPSDQWAPLFYRILQNGVRDWHRRQKVRRQVLVWTGLKPDQETFDAIAEAPDLASPTPDRAMQSDQAMQDLEIAIAELPPRQREAFLLRNFEGLDVAQTALAMKCGQGSVKTHYSRAIHALRDRLGEHWS